MSTRPSNPILSQPAQSALEAYRQHLCDEVDLRPATVRNYVSDLQHFMAWCETVWSESQNTVPSFALERVATPTLTRYLCWILNTFSLISSCSAVVVM